MGKQEYPLLVTLL